MFRAISYIIWGTESRHKYLRTMVIFFLILYLHWIDLPTTKNFNQVVRHIETHWRELKSLVLAEWNIRSAAEYSSYMGTNGIFASELECVVATKTNDLNLSIYRRVDNNPYKLKRILYNELEKRYKIANLLFTGRDDCGHYDVLVPISSSVSSSRLTGRISWVDRLQFFLFLF